MEQTSEPRTTTLYTKCRKCGLTCAPQMMLCCFEREDENSPWRVVGWEHLNGCPPVGPDGTRWGHTADEIMNADWPEEDDDA